MLTHVLCINSKPQVAGNDWLEEVVPYALENAQHLVI